MANILLRSQQIAYGRVNYAAYVETIMATRMMNSGKEVVIFDSGEPQICKGDPRTCTIFVLAWGSN